MKRPIIVGIAGGSGSGKTTICRKIEEKCSPVPVLILESDHYYRDLSHLTAEERTQTNFDHPDALELGLLAKHIGDLAQGKSILRPTYEFASHTRSNATKCVEPTPIILVDGIFCLFHPEVRASLNYGVFVDVSDDIRFIRRLRRDINERGRTMDGIIQQYLATVRPMYDHYVGPSKKSADLVVYWDHFNVHTIDLLANMILNFSDEPRSRI